MTSPSRSRWLVALGLLLSLACSPEPAGLDNTNAEPPEPEPPVPSETALTGTAPRATGGFPSVVVFEPEAEVDFPVPEEPAVMDQYNTEFHPRLLLVRVGQTVRFKNSEDTLHNVHVIDTVTRDTEFNVATPVTGAYEHVFETPSVYDVSCGVHPSMAAIIVVTETPYVAVADRDGQFSLSGIPSGSYTVTVWNLDPSRRSQRVVTLDEGATELNLDQAS